MDGGLCGCEVLGCGSGVGDAPGDDGVGEQGDSFALDVLAAGVSAAELSLVRWRETGVFGFCYLLLDWRCDLAWVRVGTIRSTEPSKPPDRHHNRRRSFPPPRL